MIDLSNSTKLETIKTDFYNKVHRININKEIFFLKENEMKPFIYNEVIGSYGARRINPKTVTYHFAHNKNEEKIYSISKDLGVKSLISIHDLNTKLNFLHKQDYMDLINYLKTQANGEEQIDQLILTLIADLFVINTDRHFNNILGYNNENGFNLSKTIDFNESFSHSFIHKKQYQHSKEKIKNLNKVLSLQVRFNDKHDISTFIKYLMNNTKYQKLLIELLDRYSYKDILEEVEDCENYLLEDGYKQAIIDIGNFRKEQIKKIITEPKRK